VATGDVTTGIAYCFGDGSGSACPCANWGATGEGCLNSTGGGGNLSASGAASVSSDTLSLTAAGLPFGVSGIFFGGTTQLGAGNGVPYGDGLICAGGAVTRLQIVLTSGAGTASSSVGISLTDGATAGQTRSYQYWHRDPAPGACGGGFNLTNAVAIDWMN
jgi:hypothetical protein